jgi:monooxygenase
MSDQDYFDTIIIGAGISGICAAYHLQTECPQKKFVVLEGRATLGGTWDLFKYPGIRSDSDMFTFGFPFSPWESPKTIADGQSIMDYLHKTVNKFGIDKKIQYNQKVIEASWNGREKLWTLAIAPSNDSNAIHLKCRFLFMCSGYYNYEKGYLPKFEGYDDFAGKIVHPQLWDTNLDHAGKRIIVVGSGATAVTLVPTLAQTAQKVYMLQRTPTYISSLPSVDRFAEKIQKIFPEKMAHGIMRWRNISISLLFYKLARRYPNFISNFVKNQAKKRIGPNYNEKDFSPPYNPWDQRVCFVPDGDLFKAIKAGKAEIVTDQINRFTQKGILLKSGKELEADLIVTATGLDLQLMGGIKIAINHQPLDVTSNYVYRGAMISGVPNFAFGIGYINASWTMKVDLTARFVCKILNHMDKKGYSVVTPTINKDEISPERLLDFNSGYVLRAEEHLPKQGQKHPWKIYQNYFRDFISLNLESVRDKYLVYTK